MCCEQVYISDIAQFVHLRDLTEQLRQAHLRYLIQWRNIQNVLLTYQHIWVVI